MRRAALAARPVGLHGGGGRGSAMLDTEDLPAAGGAGAEHPCVRKQRKTAPVAFTAVKSGRRIDPDQIYRHILGMMEGVWGWEASVH